MNGGDVSVPYQLFMLALCVLVLAWLGIDTFFTLEQESRKILLYADTAVAVIFLGDFVASLVRAKNRRRYLLTWGWIDFLSSIPAVGVLRVGRAARVARILRLLRGVRSLRVVAEHVLQKRTETAFLSVLLATILAVVFGSIAVLSVEREGGGNIQTGSDALWWAVVTVSTTGYGDFYPVTPEGRIVAAALMVVGIGLFGTFTAFVAAWFMAPARVTPTGGKVP